MRKNIFYCIVCLGTLLFCAPLYAKASLEFTVEGLSGPPLTNVNSRLNVLKPDDKKPVGLDDIEDFVEKAPKEITTALQPYGYFEPVVKSKMTHKQDRWSIVYHVSPGPQVKVSKLDIHILGEGRFNLELLKLITNAKIKVGDAFDSELYNDLKKQLLTTALNEGYLDAQLSRHQVQIDLEKHQAQETIELNTGPQYYFGSVFFSPVPLANKFLHRFVPFKPGDPFTTQQLLKLQQNLNESGYFSTVHLNPQKKESQANQVPLNVDLGMQKKIQYSLGLGYGTDTGPRGTFGLNLRWLNSMGQNFKTLITASSIQSDISARYTIPGKDPLNQQYFVSGTVAQETPPNDSAGTLEKVSAGYITRLGDWVQTFSLNAQHEVYKITGGPYQTSNLIYPQINWATNTYDNLLFPLEGGSVNFNVLGTSTYIASNATFLQTEAKGQYIYSITPANRFVARADIGYTMINDLYNLPLSLQFFAGGSQSIRGYSYQALGPGRKLAIGSIEYQREVYNKWYATVFYDVGNAANDLFQCSASDKASGTNCGIKQAPGIGVMWASPVGPIELTLAKALDSPNSHRFTKAWHIEFLMGTNL